MKIELEKVPIQKVVEYSFYSRECKGYRDDNEDGVYGMKGRLNIRPQYQREFVYKDAQRNAVIETVRQSFPLNVMYWAVNEDGRYEVIDGQQRLISIGQYVSSDFSVDWEHGPKYFHGLTDDQQKQILDYELMVYLCEGTDSEKLGWFRTINIAGVKLSEQELRNAVYTGPWLSDARRYFSKPNCAAYKIDAHKYLKGSMNRQDYLETAIKWAGSGSIEDYMSKHQYDDNAKELWAYFSRVVRWTEKVFTNYRKQMKGVEFGPLYDEYGKNDYNPKAVEEEVHRLMADDDVTKKHGIYRYVFTRDEKDLSIRTFSDNDKRVAYEKQGGICNHCGANFAIEDMDGDHIKPWSKGGKTVLENCQMLCKTCNLKKGNINEQKVPERQMVCEVRA